MNRFSKSAFTWRAVSIPLFLVAGASSEADVLHVDLAAPSGGDGISWSTAYNDLATVLDTIAASGDTVLIAQGTYRPSTAGDRFASFVVGPGVVCEGGYAGVTESTPELHDPEQFPTILSGDQFQDDDPNASVDGYGFNTTWDDNSYHVVVSDGTNELTKLLSLEVRSGTAVDFDATEPTPPGDTIVELGGGMHLNGSSTTGPVIMGCRLIDNRAQTAGGAFAPQTGGMSAVQFRHCVFRENVIVYSDTDPNPTSFGNGGAVFTTGSATVVDSVFEDNASSSYSNYGGAIHFGASFSGSYTLTAMSCRFSGNAAIGDGLGQRGGAAYVAGDSSVFANCVFSENVAGEPGGNSTGRGGAVYFENQTNNEELDWTLRLSQCTMSDNSATNQGGGLYVQTPATPEKVDVYNSIVRDNASGGSTLAQQIFVQSSTAHALDVRNSNIEGFTTTYGIDNIDSDPLFVDQSSGNYRLLSGSPCIDTGDGGLSEQDYVDVDDDGDVTELAPDADLFAREIGSDVDMGAFEWCAADVTHDGSVDGGDLGVLLAAWGACAGCAADLNGDDVVDGADLGLLLAAWGKCGNCIVVGGCGGSEMALGGGSGLNGQAGAEESAAMWLGLSPSEAAELLGFESVGEFASWLSSLSQEEMLAVLQMLL